jgi:hypothetical protein
VWIRGLLALISDGVRGLLIVSTSREAMRGKEYLAQVRADGAWCVRDPR